MITTRPILRRILFDLDNTLYSQTSGVLQKVDARIELYMQQRFAFPADQLRIMRKSYWRTYGTTLGGLMREHGVDPEEYLHFIHDIPLHEHIGPDPELDALLTEIPLRKAIFTNSAREHAQRVLSVLGIAHHFDHIFDIRSADFITKPDQRAYLNVLNLLEVPAEACLFIDDSAVNLRGAHAVGIHTVQIGDGSEVDLGASVQADYHIQELAQLRDVLTDFRLAV